MKALFATLSVLIVQTVSLAADSPPVNTAKLAVEQAAYCQSGENALKVGDYPRAEKLFTDFLKTKGLSKEQEGLAHDGLAEAYLWQSKLSQAASEFKKASSIIANTFGADSSQAARVLDGYSWFWFGQGKLDKAISASRDEIAIRKKNQNVKDLAEAQSNLAYFLETQGVYAEAADTYREALANVTQALGADAIPAADVMERLGVVLSKIGKADEGQRYFGAALKIKEALNAVFRANTPTDLLNSVYFRYFDGAPNCLFQTVDGSLAEAITANGVTVRAQIVSRPSDLVKTTRARVMIENNTGRDISILNPNAMLVVLSPKLDIEQPLNSGALASKVEKKGQGKANWIRFWGQDATSSVTSTYMGNYPQWGFFPPSYGYGYPIVNRGGGMTTVTTNVPDYQARARAMAKALAVEDKTAQDADAIRQNALGPGQIPAGGRVSGSLEFPMTKFDRALLQLPVGNSVFEFHFENR